MARSQKRIWGYVYGKSKFYKEFANRRVRRIPIKLDDEFDFCDRIGNGKLYRRYTDPWYVKESQWFFFSRQSLKEYLLEWEAKWYDNYDVDAQIKRYKRK